MIDIAHVEENDEVKILSSPQYNYHFNKKNGVHIRWGKTMSSEDDPVWSPFGPEILDLEISEGICMGNCPYCYKSNGKDAKDHHMSLDEFKTILSKMPKTLTQIAFGICDIESNKDFWKMLKYSRNQGVIPNYTCNGFQVTDKVAKKTAELCGAVAVSLVNKNRTIDAVKRFIDAGCPQVNIHYMLSEETYDRAHLLIEELKHVQGFRALVFLQYKPKGRNPAAFSVVKTVEKYKKLIDHCVAADVGYGFDSCSCPSWYQTIDSDQLEKISMCGEPCESALFSSYISCHGEFFPCSFIEGEKGWTEGLDVFDCNNFLKDIWMHPRVAEWRKNLIHSTANCKCKMQSICRACPVFDITPCKNDK